MRAALDTNLLAYAEGVNGEERQRAAIDLLERLPAGHAMVPVQALGELFRVLVGKAQWSPDRARAAVRAWHDGYQLVPTTSDVMLSAMALAANHQLGIWDAVMLSAAAESNCRVLLTEDMQNGATWNGVTVINPFVAAPHPLLASVLDGRE